MEDQEPPAGDANATEVPVAPIDFPGIIARANRFLGAGMKFTPSDLIGLMECLREVTHALQHAKPSGLSDAAIYDLAYRNGVDDALAGRVTR